MSHYLTRRHVALLRITDEPPCTDVISAWTVPSTGHGVLGELWPVSGKVPPVQFQPCVADIVSWSALLTPLTPGRTPTDPNNTGPPPTLLVEDLGETPLFLGTFKHHPTARRPPASSEQNPAYGTARTFSCLFETIHSQSWTDPLY